MRSKSIFLNNPYNDASAGITGQFYSLLATRSNEKVRSIEEVSGGINSRAFKITTDRNNEYFGKIYHAKNIDGSDRLAKEFFGLAFLWQNGIRNIPEPLLTNEKNGIAIYRFIRGSKIRPGGIMASDIDEAADFALMVHSLTRSKGADSQPIAKEACFSINEYMDCVDSRADRLKKAVKKMSIFDPLGAYLEGALIPFFETAKKEARQQAGNLGIDIDESLDRREQTLSVSDFGFHNAIRSEDGRLFFFDMEYYGWDDPVKMISDFYLQPAVPVPLNYRKRFFDRVRKNYSEGQKLEKRLSIVYPILGLKWCLIMLNMFLRIDNGAGDRDACLSQVAKSENKFLELKREMDTRVFPISLA